MHKNISDFRQHIGLSVLLIIITAVTFLPALSNEFTNWDDSKYVVDNPLIRDVSLSGISKIFSKVLIGNQHYHPLTILSWAFDYNLAGLNPWQFHFHNIFLHVINAVLVFWLVLLWKPDRMIAFLTALFFAIHPMHVESVAWITERKDLLYSFFYLWGLIVYSVYAQRKVREIHGQRGLYFVVAIFFICSLLSKPAAFIFPLAMWGIDYFYGRFSGKWSWNYFNEKKMLVIEKIPFLVLSVLTGWLANKQNGLMGSYGHTIYPLADRIQMAAYSFNVYVIKFIWPSELSCYYPLPEKINGMLPSLFMWSIGLTGIFIGILVWMVRKSKLAAFGIFFYVISIAPILGIIPIGPYLMGERYTYIPYIGLLFVLASFLVLVGKKMINKWPRMRLGLFSLGTVLTVVCMVTSFHRAGVWRDNETLWTDVIQKYPKAALAYHNRAVDRVNQKRFDEGLEDFKQALKINPFYHNAYLNRGKSFLIMNRPSEAVKDLSNVIVMSGLAEAYAQRAEAYLRLGQSVLAAEDYNRAILKGYDRSLFHDRFKNILNNFN